VNATAIEWTERVWNPVTGCSKVSEGCRNCYAETISLRFNRSVGPWNAVNAPQNVILHPDRLTAPLSWRKPAKVFVNSMSDLFHELVPDDFIDRVFAVMAETRRHTYQILTKRPDRMAAYVSDPDVLERVEGRLRDLLCEWNDDHSSSPRCVLGCHAGFNQWPLPNVWLGTSVEDQRAADERIPHLLKTPAAVRFLSCEPLLGSVDLLDWLDNISVTDDGRVIRINDFEQPLQWVIAGGESGPKARPCHPDWARSLRDQCQAAGVPYFWKQWGAWLPGTVDPDQLEAHHQDGSHNAHQGKRHHWWEGVRTGTHPGGAAPGLVSTRVGKKAAGRLLDGRTWDQFPEPQLATV
jgi:protein gp37